MFDTFIQSTELTIEWLKKHITPIFYKPGSIYKICGLDLARRKKNYTGFHVSVCYNQKTSGRSTKESSNQPWFENNCPFQFIL